MRCYDIFWWHYDILFLSACLHVVNLYIISKSHSHSTRSWLKSIPQALKNAISAPVYDDKHITNDHEGQAVKVMFVFCFVYYCLLLFILFFCAVFAFTLTAQDSVIKDDRQKWNAIIYLESIFFFFAKKIFKHSLLINIWY